MTITNDTIEEGPIESDPLSCRVIPDGLSLDWAEEQFQSRAKVANHAQPTMVSERLLQHLSQMVVRIALEKKKVGQQVKVSQC